MGLLDGITGNSWDDPKTMATLALAQGLLGGRNFSQGLLGGMQGYGATLAAAKDKERAIAQEALKQELLRAQIGDVQAQEIQRRQQAQKLAEAQGLLAGVLGNQGAPSQYGVAGGGIQIGGQREQMTPQAGGLAGATPEQIAALKANGIDIGEVWKTAQTGVKMDPGAGYVMNGKFNYMPTLDKGQVLGRDGSVSLAPGFLPAQVQAAGAIKEAEKQAENRNTLFQGVNAQGEPQPVGSISNVMEWLQQNGPLARQQRYAPAPSTPQGQSARLQDVANAEDEIRKWAEGLRKPGGAQSSASPVRTGLGPADKWSYDKERGLMVNEVGQTRPVTTQDGVPIGSPKANQEAENNNKFLAATSQARTLLSKNPTGSGIGTAYDNVAGFFGATPSGAVPAQQLRAVSGWLTSNVPRMEGPQSNFDVQNYREMAATVGDSTKPVEVRLAALDEAEKLIKKYADMNKAQGANPGPATQKPGKTVTRTGKDASGRKVVQYSDGSIDYAD